VRVSKDSRKKYEFVVVAARYQTEDGSLNIAQVYERRGPIWGDVVLLDRSQIVELIREGYRIVTGKPGKVQGDFDVFGSLNLHASNGFESLVVGEAASSQDDLQIPLF
jgi:hypothetical protein